MTSWDRIISYVCLMTALIIYIIMDIMFTFNYYPITIYHVTLLSYFSLFLLIVGIGGLSSMKTIKTRRSRG